MGTEIQAGHVAEPAAFPAAGRDVENPSGSSGPALTSVFSWRSDGFHHSTGIRISRYTGQVKLQPGLSCSAAASDIPCRAVHSCSGIFTIFLLLFCCGSVGPLEAGTRTLEKLGTTELADGLEVITLSFSTKTEPGCWKTEMLQNPSRILLRLQNTDIANIPLRYQIGNHTVDSIHLGFHPEFRPPETYLVLYLSSPGVRLGRIVASGSSMLVYVYCPKQVSRPDENRRGQNHATGTEGGLPPSPRHGSLPSDSGVETVQNSKTSRGRISREDDSVEKISAEGPEETRPAPESPVEKGPEAVSSPEAAAPAPTTAPLQEPRRAPLQEAETASEEAVSAARLSVPASGEGPRASDEQKMGAASGMAPAGGTDSRGPRIIEVVFGRRSEGETTVRITTDQAVRIGTFGLLYREIPGPSAVFSILGATKGIGQPLVDRDDPNIRAFRFQPREGPAGKALDLVFELRSPYIRVLNIVRQDRDIVLVLGPWKE